MKSLVIFAVQLSIISAECPHPDFVEKHLCDYCTDWKQARPAYRCNLAASRPYCFKLGSRCYSGHFPTTGTFYRAWDRRALIHCVEDYAWRGQHTYDDYGGTRRRGNVRYDK